MQRVSSEGTPVFPVFLRLAGRDVLVVGAGRVATRKIDELLEAGAKVRVVAPEIEPCVRELAATNVVALTERPFDAADVDGAWLVISATNDPAVNAEVAAAAEARRVFSCAVDDPERASFFFGSIVRRPPFVVALSSQGELPGLTRLLREAIEEALPSPRWIAEARALRREWKRTRTPMGDRFQELVRKIATAEV